MWESVCSEWAASLRGVGVWAARWVLRGGAAGLGLPVHLPADGLWSRLRLCTDSELFPQSYEDQELLRLIYYGGIQHEIRKAVWPFLLGHYQFGMTEAERKEVGVGVLPAQQPGALHWCALDVSQLEAFVSQSPRCEPAGCRVPFVLQL